MQVVSNVTLLNDGLANLWVCMPIRELTAYLK